MSSSENCSLPRGWCLVKLSDVLVPAENVAPQKAFSGEFTYIDIEAIDNKSQRVVGPKRIEAAKAPSRARKKVAKGDVLFSLVRPYLKNIAVVEEDSENQIASTAFIVCRPSEAIHTRFLFHFLRQDSFIQSITTYGDSPPAGHDDEFIQLPIRLAPMNEQQRIVDALDELLSDLDSGVEALNSAKAKLEHYRASVLKAAVEGELTAEWRKAHPNAEPASVLLQRILKERRRKWEQEQLRKFAEQGKNPPANWKTKYKEPVAPDTANLPSLPDGWCWTSLDALIMRGPQNGLYMPDTAYGRGTPILRIDDFQQWWIKNFRDLKLVAVDENSLETYALEENDLVINRVNSMTHLGKCVLVPADYQGVLFESNMMRMKLSGNFSLRLLKLYLSSVEGRSRLTKDAKWAVNQASINQGDVRKTPVLLAPLDEQAMITEMLDELLSGIENTEKTILMRLEALKSLAQAILSHAFSGKLVPQNPTDEPASELLKRIAAERAVRTKKSRPTRTRKTAQRRKQLQLA